MRDLRGKSIACAICGFALSVLALPAEAQWGWGGGSSHHHHDSFGHRVDEYGHHIDRHGHHTGSFGVYDRQSYPRRSYIPSYSQPHTSYYRHGANAVPRTRYAGEPIRIVNPGGSGGALHYDLNAYHFDIAPGQSQTIRFDRAWTVSFDRGAGFGEARYSLSPGLYEFEVTQRGWELFKRTSQAALAAPEPPRAIFE